MQTNFLSQKEAALYHRMLDPKFEPADGHSTTAAFVLNQSLDKVLMIYHRKYDAWGIPGGHVEPDEALIDSVKRELSEETGLTLDAPYFDEPVSVEKLGAFDHHHYNAVFLFVARDDLPLVLNEEETRGVKWIAIEELEKEVREAHMLILYNKILNRIAQRLDMK